ncbi:MAG TPA: hypothetical protein VGK23_07215 [Methanomassiliicoccales archaeon]|jgi:hypothetical protein
MGKQGVSHHPFSRGLNGPRQSKDWLCSRPSESHINEYLLNVLEMFDIGLVGLSDRDRPDHFDVDAQGMSDAE